MSEDEFLAAVGRLRIGHVLARPLSWVAGAVLLVVNGVVLLLANWRLLVLELVPAVWIAAILWDWRFHVVEGHDLTELHDGWALAVAAFVVAMTVAAHWSNVAFVEAAVGGHPRLYDALRSVGAHRRLVLGAALAAGLLHAWVSVRGPVRGTATFSIGLGAVALIDLYLYSALPAQALDLGRRRTSARQYLAKTVTSGAVSAAISLPGITLALVAHLLLGIPVLRALGVLVLVIAVVLQVAASSSSRAVSLAAALVAHQAGPGPGPVLAGADPDRPPTP